MELPPTPSQTLLPEQLIPLETTSPMECTNHSNSTPTARPETETWDCTLQTEKL